MQRLSAHDYDSVLEVVGAVGGSTTRDEFVTIALHGLAGLVSSDVSSLNEVDPAADRLVFVSEPVDVPYPPEAPAVFARLAETHPLIRHYADTGDGSAVKISDFWTSEVWHDSALFREFYRPLGVEHQMSITLPAPLPIIVAIAVNRADPGADFSERDRAVLNLVRPHLGRAWRQARDHERVAALATVASAALAAQSSLVLVLADPPADLTPGALTALYRFFGRPGARDPLPNRVRRWLQDQPPAGALTMAAPLRATRGDRQLIVRYLPAGGAALAALLLDERPSRGPGTELRRSGLTEREAEVITLLSKGLSNATIARQLSLSPWTVKRHLANSYAKLGVTTRVAAAAVVLEIAGHHGAPESRE